MEKDYQPLRKLGLSDLAIDCYISLFQDGGASVKELSDRLQRSVWSIHKCLKPAIKYGFVVKTPLAYGPKLFFAVTLDEALDNYHKYLRLELDRAIRWQRQCQDVRRRTT